MKKSWRGREKARQQSEWQRSVFGDNPEETWGAADNPCSLVTEAIINHSIKNVVGYFIHDAWKSVHRRVFHSFLFLPLVAKPHSNHVLFQVQFFGDGRDFFRGGPRLDGKVRLQRALLRRGDGRALSFPLVPVEKVRLAAFLPVRSLRLLQPGLEDRLQRDHVVVGQGEGLEPADGALAQRPHSWDLEVGQRRPDVRLGHPEFDPPLLEALGERFQLPRIRLHVVDARHAAVHRQGVRVRHGGHRLVQLPHGLQVVVRVLVVVRRRGHPGRLRSAHPGHGQAGGEVVQEVPGLQSLPEVVVVVVMVGGDGGGDVGDGHGGGGRGGGWGAGDTAHGMVSHVWFERVTLAVRDNAVSSRQSLRPCQQALIKASEYIALQLQARVRILESVGNSVRQLRI